MQPVLTTPESPEFPEFPASPESPEFSASSVSSASPAAHADSAPDLLFGQPPADLWDADVCQEVINQLWALRSEMLAHEAQCAPHISAAVPAYQRSARNLAHYLALRQRDHRRVQEVLSRLGVSSLGRAEAHVLASLDKVIGILHRLTSQTWQALSEDEPVGSNSSRKLLARHTADLLGIAPAERSVRIMVTLPSEAAHDYGLVRRLVSSGMDIARINCAHDDAPRWRAMARHVQRAAKADRRPVRIMMDLGGPKLRTGTLAPEPAVLKLRPERDALGKTISPARVGLRPAGSNDEVPGATSYLGVDPDWLSQINAGDEIELTDARGARRILGVVRADSGSAEGGVLAECAQTTYIVPETRLRLRAKKVKVRHSAVADLPQAEGMLHLQRGDILRLTAPGPKTVAPKAKSSASPAPLRVACTLPEIFSQVSVGERIWFDDGRIGGVIRSAKANGMDIEITQARDAGEKLGSDKGINLPDTQLSLPALTEKDIADLAVVAQIADIVGLSFTQEAADVHALRDCLNELTAQGAADVPTPGIVLKIETRRGFENLPDLLFAAMSVKAAGVMIARGDLAVECGYERLAEVQEEILWAAEAAHMPVIWATQVLETLAKTGLPSRAEITDAAMGERAECVMLNKGPHITDAIRTLDDILKRMQSHQRKKRPLLRALRSWGLPVELAQ